MAQFGLTERQRDTLNFIDDYVAVSGFAPSYAEIQTSLGLKSRSGVHRLMTSLHERGYIRRLPHRARAIEVIKSGMVGIVEVAIDGVSFSVPEPVARRIAELETTIRAMARAS